MCFVSFCADERCVTECTGNRVVKGITTSCVAIAWKEGIHGRRRDTLHRFAPDSQQSTILAIFDPQEECQGGFHFKTKQIEILSLHT